jgi:PPM family protein phosphatase
LHAATFFGRCDFAAHNPFGISFDMADANANWKNFVEHAAVSDVGLRRANNQDSYAIATAGDESNWLLRGHLFIVADGMGAHAAGELASKMACTSIPHTYHKLADRPAPDALKQAIVEANDQIHNRGQASADFNGMGTTTSTLALLPQGAIVGHVGDSRVYRLRGTTLEQLTFDHSLVWEMKAAGHFSGGEAPPFVPKNIITRSLGPHSEVNVDLEGPFPLAVGDTFLICSDGLSGQVTDQEIGLILGVLTPKEATRALVDLANLRGGPDNITVVIAKVVGSIGSAVTNEDPGSFRVTKPQRPGIHPAVLVFVGASLLLGAVLGILNSPKLATACVSAAVAGILFDFFRRSRTTEPQSAPVAVGALGRGPHMTLNCAPSAELVASIAQVVAKLREAAIDEGWVVNWPEFDGHCERAAAAMNAKKFGQAVREFCLGMSFMVNEVRKHRSK